MRGIPGCEGYCRLSSRARCMVAGPSPMPIESTVPTPASQARCSIASRSSSYRLLSRCACESTSKICPRDLFEPRTDFDVIQESGENRLAVFAERGGDDHAVRLQASHLA